MSGIAGIVHFDGVPVEPARIRRMSDALAARGPDGQGSWVERNVGLAHRAFRTTPEAAGENQPHQDPAASRVITFDGRVDNRAALIRQLRAAGCPPRDDTDVEIVLRAFACWGKAFVARLLGDFAFAIWDGGRSELFCARDPFGARPFYFHHRPGRSFGFASAPAALFAGAVLKKELNEARIADYLVSELEGIDHSATFHAGVVRLPPAHALTVGPSGLLLERYWQAQPGPELHLATDQDYEEAFLERFTEAVRCRLRGDDTVSAMLSGGMDSSSIVGVARQLKIAEGGPPLRTYSVIGDDPEQCRETRAIFDTLALDGLNPATLTAGQLAGLRPELSQLTWQLEEPFDYHMIVPRSLYLLAHRHGVRVMLDGIDGDSVLSAGNHLARLLRRGHFLAAWHDARGRRWVHEEGPSAAFEIAHAFRAAFAPDGLRRMARPWRGRQAYRTALAESLIHPAFAARIGLRDRLDTLRRNTETRHPLDRESDIAGIIAHPYIACGVERYERVAARTGLEARHPFLDRRLVEFCMTLPDSRKFGDGWPKRILRRAMTGYLPRSVCWRPGKDHLGEQLTLAWAKLIQPQIAQALQRGRDFIAPYVRMDEVERSVDTFSARGEPQAFWQMYEAAHLANWLRQQYGTDNDIAQETA